MDDGPGMRPGFPSAAAIVIGALLLLGRLPCTLLEPEEARYAEIPRQMLASAHFITPVLHGAPYYQKPPLLYWLVMASYGAFGVHDWAARLVPCLASIMIVAVLWGWARRRAGNAAAGLGALILCLSPLFIYRGPLLGMDTLLTLWVIVALAAAQESLTGPKLWRSWWTVSALACALGILTIGPVALILIVVPIFLMRLAEGGGPRVSVRAWSAYGAIALGLSGPWFVLAAARDPESVTSFFWFHNVQRYLSPFDHAKPAWFYLPVLFGGMMPWALLLLPMCREWKARRARRAGAVTEQEPAASNGIPARPGGSTLPLLALGWCLLFFSLSGCKRPAYIMPAAPLLAMLLGTYAAGKVAAWRRRFASRLALPGVAALMFLLLFGGVFFYLPAYHRSFGMRDLVAGEAGLAAGLPVACYPRRWDSVSFYLNRQDVRVYSLADKPAMYADLCNREAALFVKSAYLDEFRSSLPAALEFVAHGEKKGNVVAGILRSARD